MYAWPFKSERYRRLQRAEHPLLLGHLQRLSVPDRNARFLAHPGDDDLLAHVTRQEPAHEAIGWFSRGTLRAAIEIFHAGDMAEAALAVEPEWRNRGIGTELVRRALSRARETGLISLSILGHHRNYPLMAIATRLGAIEEVATSHLVNGLLPIEDDNVIGFHFLLQDVAGERPPGLFHRTFAALRA